MIELGSLTHTPHISGQTDSKNEDSDGILHEDLDMLEQNLLSSWVHLLRVGEKVGLWLGIGKGEAVLRAAVGNSVGF